MYQPDLYAVGRIRTKPLGRFHVTQEAEEYATFTVDIKPLGVSGVVDLWTEA